MNYCYYYNQFITIRYELLLIINNIYYLLFILSFSVFGKQSAVQNVNIYHPLLWTIVIYRYLLLFIVIYRYLLFYFIFFLSKRIVSECCQKCENLGPITLDDRYLSLSIVIYRYLSLFIVIY